VRRTGRHHRGELLGRRHRNAAGRPLRHAERQAYEEVLADAMRHGYNKSHGDTLDEAVIERRVDEILAAQGLTRAVIEERMTSAATALR
jgi:hypothetical protein